MIEKVVEFVTGYWPHLGAIITALIGAYGAYLRLMSLIERFKATGDREQLLSYLHELAPLAVLAVERLAKKTDTPRDDEALMWVKRGMVALGYPLPADLEQYAKDLLQAKYREYLVSIGVPANMDGAAGKAAIVAKLTAVAKDGPGN